MIKIFIITTQRTISDERHDHDIKQIDNCNQENQLFFTQAKLYKTKGTQKNC